jgi:hypothetical protein
MLGREGDEEPNENAERWRQRMAQATTALTSGWVNEEVLSIFRYSNTDNANTIWRRMNLYYGNITDIRQMRLRDVAERHRQAADESLISWMGSLNIKVSDLEASGYNTDDTYRKQLVRHNANERWRPIIQQLLLADPRRTYEDFSMALLEAAADEEDSFAPETGIEPHSLDQVTTMVEDLVAGAEADQAGLEGRTDRNSNDEGANNRGRQQSPRNRGRGITNRNSNTVTCFSCGGRGHKREVCPSSYCSTTQSEFFS